MLADGNALRAALGVRWSDEEMGVPRRPGEVEAIADPKVPIARLAKNRGRSIDDFAGEIAESISLDVLGRVPSYAAFRRTTVEALVGMGYRRSRA